MLRWVKIKEVGDASSCSKSRWIVPLQDENERVLGEKGESLAG
jgi:hypothetical protein